MVAWIASLVRASIMRARNIAATIAQRIAMIAGAIATGVVTAAQWLWKHAMMANPIGLIIAAVIAFLVILGLLAKNWDAITKFLNEVWERVDRKRTRINSSHYCASRMPSYTGKK